MFSTGRGEFRTELRPAPINGVLFRPSTADGDDLNEPVALVEQTYAEAFDNWGPVPSQP
jgi:hypothetical protein